MSNPSSFVPPPSPLVPSPSSVIHCDWSLSANKRWMASATRQDGIYQATTPTLVPLYALQVLNGLESAVIGFDVPFGLPLAYARKIGCRSFMEFLDWLRTPEWADFFRVAANQDEISLKRPFYPARPGGTKQAHLLEGLGVKQMNDLRRQCDLRTPYRNAAAPLFWTMGAQQVGKAALSAWQEVVIPALAQQIDIALWPFQGSLEELSLAHPITLIEAYPGEFYHHFDLRVRNKRDQEERAKCAPMLLDWAAQNKVVLEPALVHLLQSGFGPQAAGEDPFDAVIGLFGMLNVIFGNRPSGEPADPELCAIEGWILGQEAS